MIWFQLRVQTLIGTQSMTVKNASQKRSCAELSSSTAVKAVSKATKRTKECNDESKLPEGMAAEAHVIMCNELAKPSDIRKAMG